jgi:hypothetical protein
MFSSGIELELKLGCWWLPTLIKSNFISLELTVPKIEPELTRSNSSVIKKSRLETVAYDGFGFMRVVFSVGWFSHFSKHEICWFWNLESKFSELPWFFQKKSQIWKIGSTFRQKNQKNKIPHMYCFLLSVSFHQVAIVFFKIAEVFFLGGVLDAKIWKKKF